MCCGVVLILAVVLSGCGASSQVQPQGSYLVSLQPFSDSPSQTPRWMDIANNLYAAAFRSAFVYPSNIVQLSYTTAQAPLQFGVLAPVHALKPNFCYQMKLEGPPVAWASDPQGSDFTNWALGSNGRWWDDTDNMSLTDADLSSHVGDIIRGYLYFDFLVTAKDGSVTQTSTVNNSYHVTWKTSQRPRTGNDGPLRACSVTARKDRWAYDRQGPAAVVKLYGEGEPGRPLPGQLALPAGSYSGVEFRLTEESFHSSSAYGGSWRTVMAAPVPIFTVQ